MRQSQFIECVAERDVDLLLLEELHVSADFRSWFGAEALGPAARRHTFVGAWHSVSRSTLGESDLIVCFEGAQGLTVAILIENKIDAPAQPRQATRYRLRGEAGIRDGSWGFFSTCITAPQAYLARNADAGLYDARISYESIRDWFQQRAPADGRAGWRGGIVAAAIEQHRRGYHPVPHADVTQFWHDYWRLANVEFPQLQMKQPGQVPAGSDWPEFRNAEIGPGRRVVHKLAQGVVDLEIAAAAGFVEEIAARHQELLQAGLEVVPTGKSASLRAVVPVLDRFARLQSQMDAARAGLSAAARLAALSARMPGPSRAVE